LQPTSVERFLTIAHGQNIGATALIQIVSILAQREAAQALAGERTGTSSMPSSGLNPTSPSDVARTLRSDVCATPGNPVCAGIRGSM